MRKLLTLAALAALSLPVVASARSVTDFPAAGATCVSDATGYKTPWVSQTVGGIAKVYNSGPQTKYCSLYLKK